MLCQMLSKSWSSLWLSRQEVVSMLNIHLSFFYILDLWCLMPCSHMG